MGSNSHRSSDNKYIHPDCCIGQPTKLLQRSYLANNKADESKDKAADSIAQLELGDLRQTLTVADDDNPDIE
jgi:hypothetical protein